MKQSPGPLQTRLDKFLLQYRITPHTTTGQAPCELLMGRRLRTRLDLLRPDLALKVKQRQCSMKQNADKHARPRTLRGGEEVYVKLQPSDNEWVRGCVKSTNRNLIDMLLEDGRIIRRHLDHIRTRKHGPDAEQTLEPTVQVDSGLKQESFETTTDASRCLRRSARESRPVERYQAGVG
ncbi:hypothetical protein CLF_106779 [Clonorchis sinensis]|uniref:Uncharacterized protein n=1 Tax=Clonorchis sinensis TaxID=79923 RepID=G7YFP1_CLOSI|nr:hypothetical protein CLF_106779 [Clonorchis sinensis]